MNTRTGTVIKTLTKRTFGELLLVTSEMIPKHKIINEYHANINSSTKPFR